MTSQLKKRMIGGLQQHDKGTCHDLPARGKDDGGTHNRIIGRGLANDLSASGKDDRGTYNRMIGGRAYDLSTREQDDKGICNKMIKVLAMSSQLEDRMIGGLATG